jgi:hypothetical protein
MIHKYFLAVLLGILSIPFAHANAFRTLENVGNDFFRIVSLSWVTDQVSVTKFAFFIIIFALVYTILAFGVKGGNSGVFQSSNKNKVSMVIAFAIAAISTIFLPDRLALEIGNVYSGILAILFVGFPVGIILFLGFYLTHEGKDGKKPLVDNDFARHSIRLITALIALGILAAIAREYNTGFMFTYSILPFIYVKRDELRRNT